MGYLSIGTGVKAVSDLQKLSRLISIGRPHIRADRARQGLLKHPPTGVNPHSVNLEGFASGSIRHVNPIVTHPQ